MRTERFGFNREQELRVGITLSDHAEETHRSWRGAEPLGDFELKHERERDGPKCALHQIDCQRRADAVRKVADDVILESLHQLLEVDPTRISTDDPNV